MSNFRHVALDKAKRLAVLLESPQVMTYPFQVGPEFPHYKDWIQIWRSDARYYGLLRPHIIRRKKATLQVAQFLIDWRQSD
jgi:hypothetical protein